VSTLWHGRFDDGPSDELMALSVSVHFDRELADDDIAGSRAHVRGLARAGVLSADEAAAVLAALDQVADELRSGAFEVVASD
jgi:argininosuccinate lyase